MNQPLKSEDIIHLLKAESHLISLVRQDQKVSEVFDTKSLELLAESLKKHSSSR